MTWCAYALLVFLYTAGSKIICVEGCILGVEQLAVNGEIYVNVTTTGYFSKGQEPLAYVMQYHQVAGNVVTIAQFYPNFHFSLGDLEQEEDGCKTVKLSVIITGNLQECGDYAHVMCSKDKERPELFDATSIIGINEVSGYKNTRVAKRLSDTEYLKLFDLSKSIRRNIKKSHSVSKRNLGDSTLIDNATTTLLPLYTTTSAQYGGNTNTTSADGNATTFTSDQGNATTFTSYQANATTFTSDQGNATTFTSDQANATTFTYDRNATTFASDKNATTFTSGEKNATTFTSGDINVTTFTSDDRNATTFTSDDRNVTTTNFTFYKNNYASNPTMEPVNDTATEFPTSNSYNSANVTNDDNSTLNVIKYLYGNANSTYYKTKLAIEASHNNSTNTAVLKFNSENSDVSTTSKADTIQGDPSSSASVAELKLLQEENHQSLKYNSVSPLVITLSVVIGVPLLLVCVIVVIYYLPWCGQTRRRLRYVVYNYRLSKYRLHTIDDDLQHQQVPPPASRGPLQSILYGSTRHDDTISRQYHIEDDDVNEFPLRRASKGILKQPTIDSHTGGLHSEMDVDDLHSAGYTPTPAPPPSVHSTLVQLTPRVHAAQCNTLHRDDDEQVLYVKSPTTNIQA